MIIGNIYLHNTRVTLWYFVATLVTTTHYDVGKKSRLIYLHALEH